MKASNYKLKTNYKYESKNPISRYLVNNFNNRIREIVLQLEFASILDAGCGEGVTYMVLQDQIKDKSAVVGIDLDPEHIELSKSNAPFGDYKVGSIYELPFPNNSFDLVICLEVLEHLDFPEKAIQELERVSSKYVIVSVPREPIWRILNMARGSYWNALGNTPGHLNHWSTSKMANLLEQYMHINNVFKPIPWSIIVGQKKHDKALEKS